MSLYSLLQNDVSVSVGSRRDNGTYMYSLDSLDYTSITDSVDRTLTIL